MIDVIIIEIRSFVFIEGFVKNEYIFGMFVIKDNVLWGEIFEGFCNLKVIMSRFLGDVFWNWEFSNNVSGIVVIFWGLEGKLLRVIVYYFVIVGIENFIDGILFDFIQINNF